MKFPLLALAAITMTAAACAAPCYARSTQGEKQEAAKSDDGAVKDAGPTWIADLSKAAMPKKSAIGKLHGEAFTPDRVELQNGVLNFRQGSGFFPDLEMKFFLFTTSASQVEGRSLEILDEENPQVKTVPHIHMSWKAEGASLPKTKTWTGDYVIRLQFGQIKGGRLPGQIYVCMPDMKQSFLAGRFDAVIK